MATTASRQVPLQAAYPTANPVKPIGTVPAKPAAISAAGVSVTANGASTSPAAGTPTEQHRTSTDAHQIATTAIKGQCSHLGAVLADLDQSDAKLRMAAKYAFKLGDASSLSQPSNGKRKLALDCSACHHSAPRLALCLSCGHAHCLSLSASSSSSPSKHHSTDHAKRKGHNLALDLRTKQIYCHACDDYVFHPTAARILESPYAKASSLAAPRAPRGIRNLGQTCYMSVVLQSLFYNAPLRNYFLRDLHNRSRCTVLSCFACEVDRMFDDAFGKSTGPLAPTHFLKTFWSAANDLAGYAQQDAHEFFVSLINLLHSALPESSEKDCTCIVHTTYSGRMKSRVQCGRCGNVTTSSDPFLDLNLDLKGQTTLRGCLERYTGKEALPPGTYACSKCQATGAAPTASRDSRDGEPGPSTKQLSLERLPPVLTIQLKRFEHLPTGSVKMDSPLSFPLSIDFAPFLSSSSSPSADAPPPSSSIATDSPPPPPRMYRLQCVIEHEGQLNNGHYRAYVCGPDDWCVMDDDKVRPVSIADVKRVKPYLLTYVRQQ